MKNGLESRARENFILLYAHYQVRNEKRKNYKHRASKNTWEKLLEWAKIVGPSIVRCLSIIVKCMVYLDKNTSVIEGIVGKIASIAMVSPVTTVVVGAGVLFAGAVGITAYVVYKHYQVKNVGLDLMND